MGGQVRRTPATTNGGEPRVNSVGSETSAPLVSVVLPTRNGAATLPDLLDMLQRQRTDFSFEVIAIDSGSTDGTVDLLRPRVNRLIGIAADAFDHGLTRNAAIEQARGKFVVMLVQDAVPASEDWLALLTAPLRTDGTLAGTYARQRPRPDTSAITRYYLNRSLAASDAARVEIITSREAFEALDPMARLRACTFDNVCSCLRKSVWERHPFKATPIGEDVEWARDVLLDGARLAYLPEAVVIHAHDRSARYEFARTRTLHRRLYELFGLRTIPNLTALARAVASSLRLHWRCGRTEAWSTQGMVRGVALAVAWPAGQYLGALSAVRGWKPARSRTV